MLWFSFGSFCPGLTSNPRKPLRSRTLGQAACLLKDKERFLQQLLACSPSLCSACCLSTQKSFLFPATPLLKGRSSPVSLFPGSCCAGISWKESHVALHMFAVWVSLPLLHMRLFLPASVPFSSLPVPPCPGQGDERRGYFCCFSNRPRACSKQRGDFLRGKPSVAGISQAVSPWQLEMFLHLQPAVVTKLPKLLPVPTSL